MADWVLYLVLILGGILLIGMLWGGMWFLVWLVYRRKHPDVLFPFVPLDPGLPPKPPDTPEGRKQ